MANESIAGIIQKLLTCRTNVWPPNLFEKTPHTIAKDWAGFKVLLTSPGTYFYTLSKQPIVPLLTASFGIVARKYPRQVYMISAASNRLANLIRNINDEISKRRQDGTKQKRAAVFPIPWQYCKGKKTFAEIVLQRMILALYKLLVKTRWTYVSRAVNKDTAYEFKALTRRLEEKRQSQCHQYH